MSDIMSNDPFETLIDIERKCRSQAKPIPHSEEVSESWQGIGFITANQYFLSSITAVKEVLTTPPITALPDAAPWFLGVTNLRGHVLPVTDLEGFLFGSQHRITSTSRILVIDFEKTSIGFLVQQVLGIQRFAKKTLQTTIEDERMRDVKAHIEGKFVNELASWYILNLKSISQTGQFYHIIKEVRT